MIGWRLYAIAGALIGLIALAAWGKHHYIQIGIEQQKAADAKEIARLQKEADKETARLLAKAVTAEHVHDDELKDLRDYRASNPLHGGLCDRPRSGPALPRSGSSDSEHVAGSSVPADVLAMPAGDSGSDQGQPDQLGMLDLLASRADEVSAQLREWQTR